MSEERIDDIVNESAIKRQIALISDFLDTYTVKMAEASKLRLNIEGAGTIKELSTAQGQFNQTSKDTLTIQKQLAIEQGKLNGLEQANLNSLRELVDLKNRYKNSQESYKKDQKENLQLLKDGIVSQKEYNSRIVESAVKIEQYRARIKQLDQDIRNLAKAQLATPNSIGAAQAQNNILKSIQSRTDVNDTAKIKEINDLIDRNNQLIDENSDKLARQKINVGNYAGSLKEPFELLQRELSRLKSVVNNPGSPLIDTRQAARGIEILQTGLRSATAEGVNVKQSFSKLTNTFDEIANSGAFSSKFIGQFKDSLVTAKNETVTFTKESEKSSDTLGGKFSGALSNVWGFFRKIAYIIPGLGIAGIFSLMFEGLQKLISGLGDATGSQKLFNEVNEKAGKIAAEQVAKLTVYKDKLNDTKLSEAERLKVAKQYNEIADKQNKIDETQINNLSSINEKIAQQNSLIIQRAVSTAATSKLGEFADKFVEASLKLEEKIKGTNITEQYVQDFITKNTADAISSGRKAFDAARQSLDGISKTSADSSRFIVRKSEGVVLDGKKVDAKLLVDAAELLKSKNKAKAELDQAESNLSSLITPDGLTTSGGDKSKAAREKARKQLSEQISKGFEIYKMEAEVVLGILKKQSEDESLEFGKRLEAAAHYVVLKKDLLQNETNAEIDAVQAKLAVDIENLNREKKKGADIEGINREIAIKTFNANEEIRAIEKKGLIARLAADQEYFDEKKSMFDKAQKDELKKMIDSVSERKAITDQYLKADEERIAKEAEKRKTLNKSILDETKQLYSELGQFAQQLYDNKAQLIDDEQKKLNESAQKQIEAVNASNLTEIEKKKEVARITKQQSVDNEKLEARKRQLQQDGARFQRALSIATIIQSTAEAVIAALGSKPYGPQNIALAALSGAVGAVQLAKAIATPLPKYELGTDSAKKGLAMVSEKGAELVIPRSGKPYLTPAFPTLTHLEGGEKIFPADKTAKILQNMAYHHMIQANMPGSKSEGFLSEYLASSFDSSLNKVVKAINKNQPGKTIINIDSAYINKHVKN